MCIIIYNKSKIIDRQTLNNCWESNPDGAGLMYAKNGKINIMKELSDREKFFSYYENLKKENPKLRIILHFRIGTHGKKDLTNTHPFMVNDKLAFCHNGIIDIELKKESVISDTVAFNYKILKNLPDNFLKNPAITELIKNYIGYSKLLFLDSKGNVSIINEDSGPWLEGNWYSNYSYVCKPAISNTPDLYNYKHHNYTETERCYVCQTELLTLYEIKEGLCVECIKDEEMAEDEYIRPRNN